MQVVVLASGSQYRARLLSRLGIDFHTVSPDIDESAHPDEAPAALAARLAAEKASAVSKMLDFTPQGPASGGYSEHQIIIASDQLASCGNRVLGKPGSTEAACAQLSDMSGQSVEFLTSLYMLDRQSGADFSALDITRVAVRHLDDNCITRYVAADNPIDCAGSFKVESLGISLFSAVSTDDPTALVGLPLIKVCEGLRFFGMPMP